MTHKEKLEEIEEFLAERKREETEYLRNLIQQESYESNREGEMTVTRLLKSVTESKIILIEDMGNRFFNWE